MMLDLYLIMIFAGGRSRYSARHNSNRSPLRVMLFGWAVRTALGLHRDLGSSPSTYQFIVCCKTVHINDSERSMMWNRWCLL